MNQKWGPNSLIVRVVKFTFVGKRFCFAPSFNDPVDSWQKSMEKSPDFHALHDPVDRWQKSMQKTPDFHALYDPVVRWQKSMQKTPDFHALYELVDRWQKSMLKKLQIFTQIKAIY
jgi:hypothetical protein